jgi:alpha-1,2-mannosyltransferase
VALHAHNLAVDHAPPLPDRWKTRIAEVRPRTLWMVGCASGLLLAASLVLWARGFQVDFQVYRMGGQHVLGSGLYSSVLTAGWHRLPFTYPPLAALLFWPISDLSTYAGKLIWDAVDLVALTALIAVSIAAARARPLERADWRTALILVFPAGLLLYPVTNDLQLGQINLVLVLMIVADLVVGVSWRGKRLPRGVLTGLAAALKLTPLVFVPYLLATRQWRAARNMVITFIAATGLMFVVAPRASWLYFTKDAYDVKRVGSELSIGNQTLQAAILRAHLPVPHSLIDLVLVLMVAGGIALAAVAYRRSSPLLGVLLCAATGLMVSPISWNHHYVWVVPALAWLVAGVDRPARGIVWAAAAALVFMWSPAIPPAHSNVIWYLRENAYVFATLVFFASVATMLWVRRRRPAPSPSGVPAQGVRGSTAS